MSVLKLVMHDVSCHPTQHLHANTQQRRHAVLGGVGELDILLDVGSGDQGNQKPALG